LVQNKFIWCLQLNSKRIQNVFWEVALIPRNDCIGMSCNCCCKHMTIIWIGKL